MYYADHGFLRSISRKRLTSFIFKVSGRPLGGVSAMALNNILATATHTHSSTKTVWRGNPSAKLAEVSNLAYSQTATKNEATSQKGTKTGGSPKKNPSADDKTNYDHLLGNWESHRATTLQLLLAGPINRTVNVTINIFHKPVKLEGGRVD